LSIALTLSLLFSFILPAFAAGGSYSALTHLLQNGQENEVHFERFAALMRTAFAVDGLALMAWAEDAAQWGREQQKSFLAYAERMLRESFMCNRRANEVVYLLGDEETFAQKFSPFVNERNITPIYQSFNTTIAHLAQNGNAKIIFTDLALQIAVLLKK
jgi:DNA polymerase-3 subunit delta'